MPESADLEKVQSCDLCGQTQFVPEMVVGGWNLVKCANCGLVFTSPRFSEAFLRVYYEGQYFEQAGAYFSAQLLGPFQDEIQLARSLKKKIERYGHKASRFLEVGCGSGHLLEAFLKVGGQGVGIDLSLKAIGAGVARGLDLRAVGIDDPGLGLFDLVGAFHILEHLPSPKAFFRHCYQRLVPTGYLLLEVPNYGCRQAQKIRERWPYLYPDIHLYQFTERTIHQYLQQAHFQVLQSMKVHGRGPLEDDGASFPLRAARWKRLKTILFHLRHLVYWVPGSRPLVRHWLWHRLGYGEFIRVLARKTIS